MRCQTTGRPYNAQHTQPINRRQTLEHPSTETPKDPSPTLARNQDVTNLLGLLGREDRHTAKSNNLLLKQTPGKNELAKQTGHNIMATEKTETRQPRSDSETEATRTTTKTHDTPGAP